jgi:hypothetical protein
VLVAGASLASAVMAARVRGVVSAMVADGAAARVRMPGRGA